MKTIIITVLLVLLPHWAPAENLTPTTRFLLTTANTIAILDGLQTINFHRGGVREKNPLLPSYPKDIEVGLAVLATIGINHLAAYRLKGWKQKLYFTTVILTQAACVVGNHRLGVRVRF